MLPQARDFLTEVEELDALLVTLAPSDWARPTGFKQWTIDDIVQHLHSGDLLGAASAESPEKFAAMRAETQALRDQGLTRLEETRRRIVLTGEPLRRLWRSQAEALARTLGAMAADARLKWSGPDMGVRMFATARQMETWAHGQAIYDLLGRPRRPTMRLRNIAEIGVRTYGWTFANRGRPTPGPAPFVRLAAPDGGEWSWNDPACGDRVEGDAEAFCQVVTQTRNVTDTTLQVTGAAAEEWMRLAQCFAGPPETPPAPGTRVATRAAP